MSSLWINNKKEKGDIVGGSPELKQSNFLHARKIRFSVFFGGISQSFSIQIRTIKGTSLRMSRRVGGSMTVEAAIVLPLFLIFFLNLGSAMEMLRLHSRVESAVWETGRELCLYATAIKKGLTSVDEVAGAVGNLVLSYTYVKGRVEAFLGEDYLESAPIQGGKGGLQYLGSEILSKDGRVEILVSYLVQPKWVVAGFHPFLVENRYCGRLWTGFDIENEDGTVYYLAENMSVYHLDRECSYLRLQPRRVSWDMLSNAVNAKGNSYRRCSKCSQIGKQDEVWISPEGDCYHFRVDCPGLTRKVRPVLREELGGLRPCSRCSTAIEGASTH